MFYTLKIRTTTPRGNVINVYAHETIIQAYMSLDAHLNHYKTHHYDNYEIALREQETPSDEPTIIDVWTPFDEYMPIVAAMPENGAFSASEITEIMDLQTYRVARLSFDNAVIVAFGKLWYVRSQYAVMNVMFYRNSYKEQIFTGDNWQRLGKGK